MGIISESKANYRFSGVVKLFDGLKSQPNCISEINITLDGMSKSFIEQRSMGGARPGSRRSVRFSTVEETEDQSV